jgi:hypothetical protein
VYKAHNPAKLTDGTIDGLLQHFVGNELGLIQQLYQKYGVDGSSGGGAGGGGGIGGGAAAAASAGGSDKIVDLHGVDAVFASESGSMDVEMPSSAPCATPGAGVAAPVAMVLVDANAILKSITRMKVEYIIIVKYK